LILRGSGEGCYLTIDTSNGIPPQANRAVISPQMVIICIARVFIAITLSERLGLFPSLSLGRD
jgi:hypothetical protein